MVEQLYNQKVDNQWLQVNNKPIQHLKKQLLEYSYRGQDDLPVRTIRGTIDSAIIEIGRLQRELDSANETIKQMKTDEAEKPKEKDSK